MFSLKTTHYTSNGLSLPQKNDSGVTKCLGTFGVCTSLRIVWFRDKTLSFGIKLHRADLPDDVTFTPEELCLNPT